MKNNNDCGTRKNLNRNRTISRPAGKAESAVSCASTGVVGSAMFPECAWAQIARSLKLSGRELQVVRAAFDDQKERSIAVNLGISSHTVHTYLERLHRKLGVANRTQLLVLIMEHFLGLTEAPESTLPSICSKRAAGCCPLHG